MNALRARAIDMISQIPDTQISDVITYLTGVLSTSAEPEKKKTLDFSKYTRKGTIPLGMDAQKWVEELRSGDRI